MTRHCGDCTLCCRLLPIKEIGKPANTRCTSQRHTGCRVYRKAGFPTSCALWNCAWLVDDDARDLRRPDRAHYVIDTIPDFVRITEDGVVTKIPVIQIWCDPAYPDAHRDPALRDWLAAKAAVTPCFGLVRYSSGDAFVLIPPALNGTDHWIEGTSNSAPEPEHTQDEIKRVWLGEGGRECG